MGRYAVAKNEMCHTEIVDCSCLDFGVSSASKMEIFKFHKLENQPEQCIDSLVLFPPFSTINFRIVNRSTFILLSLRYIPKLVT